MNEVMELRCLLEEGQIIKHIMTSTLIIASVEAVICIKCLVRWVYR
jgi:hypothetical protein